MDSCTLQLLTDPLQKLFYPPNKNIILAEDALKTICVSENQMQRQVYTTLPYVCFNKCIGSIKLDTANINSQSSEITDLRVYQEVQEATEICWLRAL